MAPKAKTSWVRYLPFLIIPLLAISWGISKYRSTKTIPVSHLRITAAPSPMGHGILPEQRRAFALKLQKNPPADYKDAVFTTIGDFHTSLSIQSDRIDGNMVRSLTSGEEPCSNFRKMGFKHVLLSNGREAWDIDLGN
ncbi:hypothetical protein AOG2_32510 [Geobacter sp. AOG2]|nr:hypothetical protein AOG2_32510 [Geobacter sp. AOG2]